MAITGLAGWQFAKLGSFVLHKIKMELQIMELKNDTKNLQKIVLDQYNNQDEVYYRGHLYDVVSWCKEGNKFVLNVVNDTVEKKMEQMLAEDGEDEDDEDAQNEKTPDWIKEFLLIVTGIEEIENSNLLCYNCNFNSLNIEPEIKPPILFS